MSLRCVIFDMDGLMFDSERINGECFKKAAREYGYNVTDEIRLKMLGKSKKNNEKLLKEHFGDNYPAIKISQLSTEYRDEYIKENGLPIKTGLIELLKYLKEHKILVAVASSSLYKVVVRNLKITDTYQYIDYIVSGDQVKQSKPDPEIFMNVLNHYQLNPDEAIVLEDSENGILAAVNGNIPVICIPDLVYHRDEINDLTLVVLKTLADVIEYIKDR